MNDYLFRAPILEGGGLPANPRCGEIGNARARSAIRVRKIALEPAQGSELSRAGRDSRLPSQAHAARQPVNFKPVDNSRKLQPSLHRGAPNRSIANHSVRCIEGQSVAADATIDAMQHNIGERAVETIARRQPVADDLRQVIGILRIANKIERIGDLAKNIAKRIIAINGGERPRMLMSGVKHMATLMLGQLRDVLDSFACRDVAKAIDVWTRDQDIDRLCTNLCQELLVDMTENSVATSFGAHLMFCTKNLERMGDHATNIAEAVHYMVKGETLLRERPKADFTSTLTVAMGRT